MLTKSICVYRNHLCMTGLWFSPYGVIPFAERIPLSTEQPDGNIGSERNEVIEAAIGEAKEAIMAKNSKEIVKASVESLVIRARAGDQNAMGMLASIQKAAKEGNEKALRSYKLARDYIMKNPPGGQKPTESPRSDRRMLASLITVIKSKLHYPTAVLSFWHRRQSKGCRSSHSCERT